MLMPYSFLRVPCVGFYNHKVRYPKRAWYEPAGKFPFSVWVEGLLMPCHSGSGLKLSGRISGISHEQTKRKVNNETQLAERELPGPPTC